MKSKARIIITTRTSRIEHFTEFEIQPLEPDECVELFYYYYGNRNREESDREKVENIVKWAKYNTLLIEIIAKSANRSTIKDYAKKLKKEGFDAIKDTEEKKLHKLYDISKFKRNKELQRILWNFAIMPENTCITLEEAKKWFNFKEKDLEKLVDSGWLSFEIDNIAGIAGYEMHPLVSELIKELNKGKMPKNAIKYFMRYVGNGANKFFDFEDNRTTVEIGRRIEIVLPFIDYLNDRDSLQGAVCNNIGNAYYRKGEYDEALTYHKKALSIREAVLGENHPDTAASYNNIGLAYKNKGEYDEALTYHKKAVAIYKAVLGEKHPFTATSYNNIGLVYSSKGEYDEALTYYKKALAICKAVLGEKHPYTAGSYNNIGNAYYAKGEYDKALKYYNQALSIREAVLGENHPDTATSYNNIGCAYDDKGEYDKALKYHKKAVAIREAVLGEQHPDTATSYNNIGCAYDAKGEYDEALKYHKKVVTIREAVLGEQHPYTAGSYNNIGCAYDDKGEYDEALKYYTKAVAIAREKLGENHHWTKQWTNNLRYCEQEMR